MIRRTHRSGLTLTEVLVTLAILAFGILGILTLFPLAASQMAIAVREDRSAQAANAADGYMRAYWKSEIVEKMSPPPGPTEAIYTAFDNPGGGLPALVTPGEPSYPVAVDPMGYFARSGPNQNWVGDSAGSKMPRRTLNQLSTSQYAFRVCSLMDSMGYDDNGHPTTDREMRYNWMWLLQCPDVGNKTTATMSVVVFDNRPNLFASTGAEGVYGTTVVPGTTQLTFGGTVNIKAGGWILDVTDPTANSSFPGNKIRHSYPYQVVSVIDGGTYTTLELQKPLMKANDPGFTPLNYSAKFVVLRGVTNIYPRAPLTP